MGGTVQHVRELSTGVQADVSIGASGTHGYASIRVVTQDKRVMAALDALKRTLRDVASETIAAAQADEVKRGRTPLGLPVDRAALDTTQPKGITA